MPSYQKIDFFENFAWQNNNLQGEYRIFTGRKRSDTGKLQVRHTANTPFDVDGLYYYGAKLLPHLACECALDSHMLQETSLSSRHSSCVATSIDNYKYCFPIGAKCQFFKSTHNVIK